MSRYSTSIGSREFGDEARLRHSRERVRLRQELRSGNAAGEQPAVIIEHRLTVHEPGEVRCVQTTGGEFLVDPAVMLDSGSYTAEMDSVRRIVIRITRSKTGVQVWPPLSAT